MKKLDIPIIPSGILTSSALAILKSVIKRKTFDVNHGLEIIKRGISSISGKRIVGRTTTWKTPVAVFPLGETSNFRSKKYGLDVFCCFNGAREEPSPEVCISIKLNHSSFKIMIL